jgi:hypothetical protein
VGDVFEESGQRRRAKGREGGACRETGQRGASSGRSVRRGRPGRSASAPAGAPGRGAVATGEGSPETEGERTWRDSCRTNKVPKEKCTPEEKPGKKGGKKRCRRRLGLTGHHRALVVVRLGRAGAPEGGD